jgi:hypothetical protein
MLVSMSLRAELPFHLDHHIWWGVFSHVLLLLRRGWH